MTRNKKGILRLATGLLVGATAGYVIGTLLAPKKGEEVREDIKDFSGKFKEDVTYYLNNIKDKGNKILHKGKKNIETFKNKTDDRLINFLDETKKQTKKPVENIVQKVKRTSSEVGDNINDKVDELSEELKSNINKEQKTYNTNNLFDRIKGLETE